MPDERPVLRETGWHELFPWLILARSFRVATQVRMLSLAAVGVALTVFGWWLLANLFSGSEAIVDLTSAYRSCPWRAAGEGPVGLWTAPGEEVVGLAGGRAASPQLGRPPSDPYLGAWYQLAAPGWQMFRGGTGITGFTFLLLCLLWSVAVWSFFGGALSRVAIMQLARSESVLTSAALRYARRKYVSYFSAPLLPLLGVLVLALPMVVCGLLVRANVGAVLITLLWPLLLVAGILMAILLIGVMFGWPLMWATISGEGTDSFDAISRSYCYVQQRPFHYLFYAAVAAVLGILGLLVAALFAEAVWWLPLWAVQFGAGETRTIELLAPADDASRLVGFSSALLYFWRGVLQLVVLGFVYSYFWTSASAIYLLLRQDVDGTELDKVYVDDEGDPYGLPTLQTDAAGVPVVPPDEAIDGVPPSGGDGPTAD